MSDRETLFSDVILPIAVRNEFTYRVPFELNELLQIGVRVVVPFGKGNVKKKVGIRQQLLCLF